MTIASTHATQAEFWQLTATLNSIRIEVLRPGRRARLQDADPQADASVSFVDRDNGPSRAAPGGLDGKKLSVAADRSLRAQLAEQLVASDEFRTGRRESFLVGLSAVRLHAAGRRPGSTQSGVASRISRLAVRDSSRPTTTI